VVEASGDRISGEHPKAKGPRARKLGVVDQVALAFSRANLLSTIVGCVFGGFVPAAGFVVSHFEVPVLSGFRFAIALAIVAGALVVSARTVYAWALLAFADRPKAVGFVVLVEGVMTFATHDALAGCALVLIVLVNGIAAGCRLSGVGK
jgi:hypothetical protein